MESRKLTFMQMITAAVLALVYTLAAGGGLPSAGALCVGALPVLYLGLMSTCLCFFLQTAAQSMPMRPRRSSFCRWRGVFGSLFSVMLGLEPFTWMLGVGGSSAVPERRADRGQTPCNQKTRESPSPLPHNYGQTVVQEGRF